MHSSELSDLTGGRPSPQARLEPSIALRERLPVSSFLHRADVADPGIGSLPGQEPIRAKRSMSDSRQYVPGSHVDGVVRARSSDPVLRCRAGLCAIKPY